MNDTKSKEKYYAYLQTDTWKQKRDRVVKRDMGRCRICNSSKFLNVHHRKYPEVYGEELLIDLITLCKVCHELFHFKINSIRQERTKKPPSPRTLLLRKAAEKLKAEGVTQRISINPQKIAKIICKRHGFKYPPKGKRIPSNCMQIVTKYLDKGPPLEEPKREPEVTHVLRKKIV